MEESWFGFLIAGGLCSKPGTYFCNCPRMSPLASLGRHDRFGRLCNLGLPKTLRFSLQRHKTPDSTPEFYGGILFWLWESKRNCAFKKAGKIQGRGETNAFDAMVSPLPIYLPETLQFRAAPKNAVHFLYGAALHRPGERPWTPRALLCFFRQWNRRAVS